MDREGERVVTTIADGSNRAFSWRVHVDAPRRAVWRLWTDVALWPEWDTELATAELEGAYDVGAKGTLTPKRGQPSRFYVDACDEGALTTVVMVLPLARLVMARRLIDGSVIEHAVTFEGPLAGLWAALLGPRFRAALPGAMERLRMMAELAAREPRD